MSDVNVGGVTAELALGFQDWNRGLDSALKALEAFSSGVGSLLTRFQRSVEGGSRQAGQSLQTFSDTATRELQEVTRSVQSVGASMATEFRAAASATQQGNAAISAALSAVTRVLEKVDQRVDRLAQQVDKSFEQMAAEVARSSQKMDASLEALGSDISTLAGDVKTQTDRIDDAFEKMAKGVQKSSQEASDAAGKFSDAVRDGAERIGTAGKWLAGAGVAMETALGGVVLGALRAANEIEGFQVQLETLTGSAEEAASKLDFFREYAVKSPFELKELVDAGVQLEAYGQQAEKWLPRVGDFASSMNLSVVEAARGVGKALSGSPDGWEILRNAGVGGRRLAPFGAVLTKEGNIDAADPRNADALLRYLETLEGSSDKKSETIGGRWSMVADALSQAFAKLGEQLAPIAKQVADALAAIITAVGNLPPAVMQWGLVIAGAAAGLAILTGGFLMLAPVIAAIPAAFTAVTAAIAALAPYMVPVAAALVALAAGAAALWVAWEKNWGGIQEKTESAIEAIQDFLAGFWIQVVEGFNSLKTDVTNAWAGIWESAKSEWNRFRAEIEPGLVAVQDFFARVWPEIQGIVDAAMAFLVPLVQHSLRDIQIQFEAVAAVLGTIWSGLWSGIKTAYQIAWPLISGLIESNLKSLRGIFEAALKLLTGDWSGAWQTLQQASQESLRVLSDGIGQALDRILEALWNFIPSMVEVGGNIGSALWQAIKSSLTSDQETWSGMVAQARAVSAGQGFSSQNYGGQLAGWLGHTRAKGAEARRFDEQQALWERRRAKGESARRAQANQDQDSGSDAKPEKGKKPASRAQIVSAAEKVVSEVNRRVGGVFQPGDPEQCAAFVRDVYRRAGVKLGVTQKPIDNGPVGALLASSFVGTDVGQIITDRSALKPGDIVTYRNTYGNFEPGAITHAGIYSGGGQIVHRPTRSGQVTRAGLDDPGQFAYGVRPYAVAGEGAAEKTFQRLQQWREQMQGLSRAQETLETRLSAVDERYSSIAREGAALGASREDLARVEAARLAERSKLLAEQAEKERALLAEMSAQRLALTGTQAEQERAALDKRFTDMVAYWQRVATETPALAAQVQEHLTALEQEHEAARASLRKGQAREAAEAHRQAWMERYNQGLAEHEWQVQMGREGTTSVLGYLAEQLDAWQGTEAEKRAAMLRYREEFQRDLQLRAEYQGVHYEESLEALLEHLMAQTDLTVAEQVRRDALLEELAAVRHAKTLEFQQVAQNVAQAFEGSFASAFVGILNGQQTFSEGMKGIWRSLADTIIAEIARIIAKLIALRAMQMLTGFFFPVGGAAGSSIGSSVGAMLPTFHTGGVVGAPGLRHDEVVAKLQTGEVVLSRSDLRAISESGGGGASVNLTVQNLHHHGPQDTQAMARDLGRRMAFYVPGG